MSFAMALIDRSSRIGLSSSDGGGSRRRPSGREASTFPAKLPASPVVAPRTTELRLRDRGSGLNADEVARLHPQHIFGKELRRNALRRGQRRRDGLTRLGDVVRV